jgi:hypothetical protein
MATQGVAALLFFGPVPRVPAQAEPPAYSCLGRRATIVGTAGPDEIRGTRAPDVIAARVGDDVA